MTKTSNAPNADVGSKTSTKTGMEVPAIAVKYSITREFLISLHDGSKHVDLRPHLKAIGNTPAQYAERFGLPLDYPLIAPNHMNFSYGAKNPTIGVAYHFRGFLCFETFKRKKRTRQKRDLKLPRLKLLRS